MTQLKTFLKNFPFVKILTDTEDKHSNNNIGLYLLKAQYALEQRNIDYHQLLNEVNNLPCFYCDRLFQRDQLTIDHFKPKYLKGTNDSSNLVLACDDCNKAKGSIDPQQMPITFARFLSESKKGIWHKRLTFLQQMNQEKMSELERKLLNKLIKMESRPYQQNNK